MGSHLYQHKGINQQLSDVRIAANRNPILCMSTVNLPIPHLATSLRPFDVTMLTEIPASMITDLSLSNSSYTSIYTYARSPCAITRHNLTAQSFDSLVRHRMSVDQACSQTSGTSISPYQGSRKQARFD